MNEINGGIWEKVVFVALVQYTNIEHGANVLVTKHVLPLCFTRG